MKSALCTLLVCLTLAAPVDAQVRRHVPGCWYGEQRYDGLYACLVRGSHVQMAAGALPLPGGDNVLGLRVTPDGLLKIAGQSHGGLGTWEWTAAAGWRIVGPSYGVNPVLYDYQGTLHLGHPRFGSQGLRFAERGTGRIWTGDETYADHARRIGEWSTCGDVTVGQSGWSVAALADGKRYTLDRGSIVNIRLTCDGPAYAVSWHKQDDNSWTGVVLNRSEFATFPIEKDPEVPPPPPVEICGDGIDNDNDGAIDEGCHTEPPPQTFTYDLGPLNEYAQRRWNELPHTTGHEQAAALYRILWEFAQKDSRIEVYRKCDAGQSCGTVFTASDGHHYAEDIVVINLNGVKWWSDVGVQFGIPSAHLNFNPNAFVDNRPTTQPERCFAPPAPAGQTEPPPVEICGDNIDNDKNGYIDETCPVEPPPPGDLEARVKELEQLVEILYDNIAANEQQRAAQYTYIVDELIPSRTLKPEEANAFRAWLDALKTGIGLKTGTTMPNPFRAHDHPFVLRWEFPR